MDLVAEWGETLRKEASGYARLALENIRREFPSDVHHVMTKPGDFPFRPKARTPTFYGSFDWHSCLEMHWLLLRLLRTMPDRVPVTDVRIALNAHFSPVPTPPRRSSSPARGRWASAPTAGAGRWR